MADRKIIAIAGATGAQGGGLANAILGDQSNGFAVRALTRDPSADAAKALADQGAEVVQADLDDEASLENAFEGVHGAYCVTFYWAHFSPETEQAHAAAMARAAKKAGVHHVIWSTLEDTREFLPVTNDHMPTLLDKYNVPHFDSKGEANQFFADVPTTLLHTSFYWDNFITLGMGPKRDEGGSLILALPMADKKLPGIAAEDIGGCAYGIFKRGEEFVGKTLGIAGEHLTGEEMAAAFSRALGEDVAYHAVPPDVYRGFGFPGADDLGNMFQFKCEFEDAYVGGRDLELARALNPSLHTLDSWLDENRERILVE